MQKKVHLWFCSYMLVLYHPNGTNLMQKQHVPLSGAHEGIQFFTRAQLQNSNAQLTTSDIISTLRAYICFSPLVNISIYIDIFRKVPSNWNSGISYPTSKWRKTPIWCEIMLQQDFKFSHQIRVINHVARSFGVIYTI